MSTTHDVNRFLVGSGISLAAVLAGVTGAAWWFQTTFIIFEPSGRQPHQIAALGLLVWAVSTAVLGVATAVHFRAPLWSVVVVALTVLALALCAARERRLAAGSPPSGPPDYTARDLWMLPALPSSWPLLVFAGVALVRVLRARWSPGPRPQPVR